MDKRTILRRIKIASRSMDRCFPFPQLQSGSLPRSTAAKIFAQHRLLSIDFPGMLCTLAGRLTCDQARLGVISNLWDEHGRGSIQHSHRALLDRFCARFDKNLISESTATWQTRLYLNAISGIAEAGSLSEAIGMLLFLEAVTPIEYRSVIVWLEKGTDLVDLDWQFWSGHIEHDGEHLRLLLDNTVEHEEIVEAELLDGIEQSCHLETLFWSQFEGREEQ